MLISIKNELRCKWLCCSKQCKAVGTDLSEYLYRGCWWENEVTILTVCHFLLVSCCGIAWRQGPVALHLEARASCKHDMLMRGRHCSGCMYLCTLKNHTILGHPVSVQQTGPILTTDHTHLHLIGLDCRSHHKQWTTLLQLTNCTHQQGTSPEVMCRILLSWTVQIEQPIKSLDTPILVHNHLLRWVNLLALVDRHASRLVWPWWNTMCMSHYEHARCETTS